MNLDGGNSNVGHVGYVVSVSGSSVFISHGNYDGNGNCSARTHSIYDHQIIGFYKPSRGPSQKDCGHYDNHDCPW